MSFSSVFRPMILALAILGCGTNAWATISGVRTVGPTGDYATLGAALSSIQSETLDGPLVLELQSTYTCTGEIFPLNFTNLTTTATNTLTVRPQTGASNLSISGSAAGIIDLVNAGYVTVDGRAGGTGTGQDLTVENTNTSGAAVRFYNAASNNALRYVKVRGVNSSSTSGVVTFTTSTGDSGNSSNVLDNCDIAPSSGSSCTNAIYSSGSNGLENSSNQISNCTISDFFSASRSTAGILLAGNSTGWTIENNRIFQTATRTYTSANSHYGVRIGSGQGHTISGNVIGYATAAGTGTWTMAGTVATRFIGVDLAVGTTATSVQGNTINGFSLGTSSTASTNNGVWCGINVTSGNVNIGTGTANTIGGTSGVDLVLVEPQSSGALLVGMNLEGSGTISVQNNKFGGMTCANASTASINTALCGIQYSGSGSLTVSGNEIGSGTATNMRAGVSGFTTGSTLVGGISIQSAPGAVNVTSNTVQNMVSYGTGSSGYVRGIWTLTGTNSTPFVVSGNTVHDLQAATTFATVTSGLVGACGISTSTGTSNQVTGNTVFNIARTNTGSGTYVAAGIVSAASTNTTISGNKIYGITNAGVPVSATSPQVAAGILIRSGTTSVTIANNMISLGTGQTGDTTFVGIWGNHGSPPNPTDYIYQNTICITGTVSSGSQASFGFHRGDFSTNSRTSPVELRNNLIVNSRSGGTGSHFAIGDNSTGTASSSGWSSDYNALNATGSTVGSWASAKTFAEWQTASGGDSHSFSGVSVTFADPASDLHLNMGTSPTVLESGGITLSSITTDFDGQQRPGPSGSVNGGAILPDIGADEFDGVYLDTVAPVISLTPLVGLSTAGRTLSNVSIKDVTGVPTNGSFVPRIYFCKNGGTYTSAAGTLTSGNAQDGLWSFTISAEALGGLVQGDVVSYFILAQDTVDSSHLVSSPSGAVGASVNSFSVAPSTPLTATVYNDLTGSYTVGAGGAFATLTAAMAAYNADVITGPTTFLLTDATYSSETFPVLIKEISGASATKTLTIKPAPGVSPTITGSSDVAILQLEGARYVTIDGHNGSTQNSLSPRVTASRDLTIQNSNSSTSSAVVWLRGSDSGSPVQHCTVQNCVIKGQSPSSTGVGLGSGGSGISVLGKDQDDLGFINNAISDCQVGVLSQGESSANKNNGLTINLNTIGDIGGSGSNQVGKAGIVACSADNVTVSANSVSAVASSSYDVVGIALGYVADSFNPSSTGLTDGISNATVTGNKIGTVQQQNSASAVGIALGNSASGTLLVANNMISGVIGSPNGGELCAGIILGGGNATIKVLHNTVAMQGTMSGVTAATGFSACLAYTASTASSTPSALQIRNNIFTNSQNGNSGASALLRITAISLGFSTPYAALYSDCNALYSAGSGPGTYTLGITAGVYRTTFADWQDATGQEPNSLNVSPNFVSSTDLHLASDNQTVIGAGSNISEITDDFDLDVRNGLPDLGADEYSPSTNANLKDLAMGGGSFSPAFGSSTTSYSATVAYSVTGISVTPTAVRNTATIKVNGSFVPSGGQSDEIPLAEGDNSIQIVVTAQDTTTQKTYTLVVHRNAKPVFDMPASPKVVTTSALIPVAVNFSVTATDPEDGPVMATVSAQSGDLFPLGDTIVTVSATDSEGVTAEGQFVVRVSLESAYQISAYLQGDAAPGNGNSGLPENALLTGFNTPATDNEAGIAFVAKWISQDGSVRGTGLFHGSRCLAIVGGDASAIVPGATWKSFSDPVIESGKVACLAKLSTGQTAVVCTFTGEDLEKIALTGETAEEAGDAKFKAFKSVALQGGAIGFLAQLSGGSGTDAVKAGNDMGIWAREPGGTLHCLHRDGTDLGGGKLVKSFVSFQPGVGSPGQGRGWLSYNEGPLALALNILTDKSQAISMRWGGGGVLLAQSGVVGGGTAPALSGASFASFRSPALNDSLDYAFYAKLTVGKGGVVASDSAGIFASSLNEDDPVVAPELIARIGHPAGATGASFSVLSDPVISPDGDLAFLATLKGGTLTGNATRTIWWKPAGQSLALLAQGGQRPGPDLLADAQWKTFTSVAMPGGGRGPIFAATMVPGKGGVTSATASGVWACDVNGDPRLLFRTGYPVAGKILKKFTMLQATAGASGVTRSFNDIARVVWLATFVDNSTAIITTVVP